ncbi:type IV pilin protein [Paraglaciecola sp. L3A3]|uniref:type IV pilin protein n=1 Tax=Paraglaciecola sp. L3A3 TaxID=2686358 RepID=UPI00131E18AD|nr:type IV pilin protein [Paraglaciecola sp. L3A3]
MNSQVNLLVKVKLLNKKLGMTLVELLFVIVIVSLLAVLVLPSFQNQILHSRRGDAVTQLLRLKLQQEVYRTKNPSYASTSKLILPKNDYYTFAVSDESATTYTLTAKAKGNQLNDKTCKSMSINQSMQKQPLACFK